jgi:predicted acyl esterase
MKSIRIERDVIFDQDVEVRMRDSVRLMANVFRPAVDRPCPVVMSVTPYGKDVLPDWVHMTLMRLTGVRFVTSRVRNGPDSRRPIRSSGPARASL